MPSSRDPVMQDLDALMARVRSEREANGGNAEIEIYPGASHGFAFPQRPVYDKHSAERHWERLFQLFGPTLA